MKKSLICFFFIYSLFHVNMLYAQHGSSKQKKKVNISYNIGGRTSIKPTSREQSNFFFTFYGTSANLWSAYYLNIPTSILNRLIRQDDEDGDYGAWRWDILKMKNNGEKIKVDNGSFVGFKAKDMFSNFQYGVRFGWQPELSPFGIYVSCNYQHRQFKAKIGDISEDWSKFRMNYIRPGLGIRVTPFVSMLRHEGWSPMIELGTAYNYIFSCKAPYENEKEQFDNGLTTSLALGARFSSWSIAGGAEFDNYDLFNKDYSPDGGVTLPYKNIDTNHVTVFISISRDF